MACGAQGARAGRVRARTGPGNEQAPRAQDADQVLEILLDALAPSEAARLAAKITGAPKNELYRKALKS